MGDCDYSVPSKGIACPSSGGRNELELATAVARVPTGNLILILSELWGGIKNTNKISRKHRTLNIERRRLPLSLTR